MTSRPPASLVVKPIRFSAHAALRLSERQIDPAEVARLIRDPAISLPGRKRTRHIIGYVRGRGMHVVYYETDLEIRVLTIYWVTP